MSKIDISRLTHFADTLIGRDAELARLDAAWTDPAQHVLVIRGIGGEGKTSLVAAWAAQIAGRNYDGASYFDWSFYSQGTRDQTAASSDSFLATALGFFGSDEGKALANSPTSARDKAINLLGYLRQERTLLVLDGLEPLQYPPGPLAGQVRDDAMSALLKGLAQNNPGLCIVTTREPVTDLAGFQDITAPELELGHLSDPAGAGLLKRLLEPTKPKGIHKVKSTLPERSEITQAVKGHALTLRILGSFIHRALRDVRRWREVDYAQADALFKTNPKDPEARYGHAFKTIEAYEHWLTSGGPQGARQLAVLRLLSLFDRPAIASSLAALRAEPIIPGLTEPLVGLTESEWNITLSELEECGLVSLPRSDLLDTGSRVSSVDAHPLLLAYFARQGKTQHPEAWRAAHRRVYEHLCETTKEGDQPTLEDLQPLYQAVAHGCQAGMQQEVCDKVYFTRIAQGGEAYAVHKLGAFGSDLGAVACFFETPWSRVSPALREADQAWLLNQAAYRLGALGRLTDAIETSRVGLEMVVKQEAWANAARSAINLSRFELTLGELTPSARDAEQSVIYAARSGDWTDQRNVLTTMADRLHQTGRRAEADSRYREAEEIQTEHQPYYPLLYSLQGFEYCDFLLARPSRAAWQMICCGDLRLPEETLTHRQSLQSVIQRAAQTIQIAERNNWLLDIAIDHLTLGRAALYEAILGGSPLDQCCTSLSAAVTGLRRAGHSDELPKGLLTRAWLRALTGPRTRPESAQADLDEAWEIAERGPMLLFLADIHMYRARLFFNEKPYPWAKNPDGTPRGPKDDLAEARRLIEKCRYWRRKEELEDAEEAAKNWPDTPSLSTNGLAQYNQKAIEPPAVHKNNPRPLKAKKETAHMAQQPIDVGIIVALTEEFGVLHPQLPSPVAEKDEKTGDSDYLFLRAVAKGATYFCAATFVGEMGPTAAAVATERFIQRRDPKTIVMLGIAAGIDGVRLGDVVVANHVGRYLENAKIVPGTKTFDIKPGGDSFPCSQELFKATQHFKFAHSDLLTQWQSSAQTLLAKLVSDEARLKLVEQGSIGITPSLAEGPIASGPVVAAAEDFINWVKSLNRNYLALEMESGGVLSTVYSRSESARTMMLRGISDFGDAKKKELDNIGKGALRYYAMSNAIGLLWQLMEAGILPRRSRSENPQ